MKILTAQGNISILQWKLDDQIDSRTFARMTFLADDVYFKTQTGYVLLIVFTVLILKLEIYIFDTSTKICYM